MLFSIALISSTGAAVYSPRRIVLPDDDEIQREMINDLLQREYAERYREYLEKSLAAASKNNMDDIETHAELHPSNKRGQTFVRFGKRSQSSVRFDN
ncbi:Uncharacterized protein BM_BM3396 [Brugia malayi]|uniref:Bm3396 n=2 Tax=Brugia TaxID=6278 RepID=A0A0H5S5Y7_BRUMA|nr:Uncharacterized protein BM_BM3396 [Brugia malayi]CRZ23807.1 Bm3396 [Brugia malayi]VIO93323.1 Uncharacterized protein BM_BM3396 [Brugia malayi]